MKARSRQREWQLAHLRAGLCTRCSRKAIAGSQLCRHHREKQREAQRRWKALPVKRQRRLFGKAAKK